MANIIKNQILKHLSKYAKNLQSGSINVSTFKGEGELKSLELHEEVLMELLEFPLWIKITKAVCNRVAIKIAWTKLKSVPITLTIDSIDIETETCEELRRPSTVNFNNVSSDSKYGFADRVVDGITILINSINVSFKSTVFKLSLEMTRIEIESVNARWQKQKGNLRATRLLHPELGHLLLFKQMTFETMKVEACAVNQFASVFELPIRLITTDTQIRITLKKRLADSCLLAARLQLILNDLTLPLSDCQLKSALFFVNSLSGLIKRATEVSQKVKAARKLECLQGGLNLETFAGDSKLKAEGLSTAARIFANFDIVETSLHALIVKLDLHLHSDCSSDNVPAEQSIYNGAAIQITCTLVTVDVYPFHLASGDRNHWMNNRESSNSRSMWISKILQSFKMKTGDIVRLHSGDLTSQRSPTKGGIQGKREPPLMTVCLVVHVGEVVVYQVTTKDTRHRSNDRFFFSDSSHIPLPKAVSSIHAEFSQYFYPGDIDLPVPPPMMFVHLNPVCLNVDQLTTCWLKAFLIRLQSSPELQKSIEIKPVVDVRLECVMPKIVITPNVCSTGGRLNSDMPKSMQIQAARVVVTNSRIEIDEVDSPLCELQECINKLRTGELIFESSTFPSESCDEPLLKRDMVNHAMGQDVVQRPKSSYLNQIKEMFWYETNRDIWRATVSSVWVDFILPSNKTTPFVDPLNVCVWIDAVPTPCKKAGVVDLPGGVGTLIPPEQLDLFCICHVKSLVNVQINCYQLQFINCLLDTVDELTNQLHSDYVRLCPTGELAQLTLVSSIPVVDISLVVLEHKWDSEAQLSAQEDHLERNPTNQMSYSGSIARDSSTPPSPMKTQRATDTGFSEKTMSPMTHPLAIPPIAHPLATPFSHPLEADGHSVARTDLVSKSFSDYAVSSDVCNSFVDQQCGKVTSPVSHHSTAVVGHKKPVTFLQSGVNKTMGSKAGGVFKTGLTNLLTKVDNTFSQQTAGLNRQQSMSSIGRLTGLINNTHTLDDISSVASYEDDLISLKSDISDESFADVKIGMEGVNIDGSFHFHSEIELANEVVEDQDDMSKASSLKRYDAVKVMMVRLEDMELSKESIGLNDTTKVIVRRIGTNEIPTMTWSEFQTYFASNTKSWPCSSDDSMKVSDCDIRLRIDKGDKAEFLVKGSFDVGYIRANIENVHVNLNSVSTKDLACFGEDPIDRPKPPFLINAKNIGIILQESPLATETPLPIEVRLSQLTVMRDLANVIHIQPVCYEYEKHSVVGQQDDQRKTQSPSIASSRQTPERTVHHTVPMSTQTDCRSELTASENFMISLRRIVSTLPDPSFSDPTMSNGMKTEAEMNDDLREENSQLRAKLLVVHAVEKENVAMRKVIDLASKRQEHQLSADLIYAEVELDKIRNEKCQLQAAFQLMQNELISTRDALKRVTS